jgi:1-phosphofructokinase family hexose kinase
VLLLTPNLCILRTIDVEMLVPGNVHRAGLARTSLGGKGVNVARVARAYGRRATIVGFVSSSAASRFEALASRDGAEVVSIAVEGEARVATVLLEKSGRVTVLNEPGVTVTASDWELLHAEVAERAASHKSLSCSGTPPPGSPVDVYARAVDRARSAGLFTVVDATGEVFANALGAEPDVVSPNLFEAEALLLGSVGEGVEPSGPDVVDRAATAVVGLVERGARNAVVSAGSRGAVFSLNGRVAWCPAPRVRVVNPIGAGDSLVGGLLHAHEMGAPWEEAVRFGVVAASASCESRVSGGVDKARVAELLAELPATVLMGEGAP